MILRRFLKTIQSEENSFQVPRSFQTEERSKTQEFTREGLPHAPLRMGQCLPCLMRILHVRDAQLRFSAG
uniref:Uncharacterized protein n=1 Tax=Medicago truncatula TaxID=3880 RepID=A2Q216_MEDTR|nr:hypothetical protein MtrDRAFT_AC149204g21v2 [Medicago truncatula]